jgi:hypothetical protein
MHWSAAICKKCEPLHYINSRRNSSIKEDCGLKQEDWKEEEKERLQKALGEVDWLSELMKISQTEARCSPGTNQMESGFFREYIVQYEDCEGKYHHTTCLFQHREGGGDSKSNP